MRFAALACILAASLLGHAIPSLASPTSIEINIYCPVINNPNNPIGLTNYGDYIAGYGKEVVAGEYNAIYFKSEAIIKNMPTNLDNYHANGIEYDSSNGQVTCKYVSSQAQESPFSVSYVLTNSRGGAILSKTDDHIRFLLPVGLRV